MNIKRKYLSQFFSRNSWPDIVKFMPKKLNLKEITEVMGVWNMAKPYFYNNKEDHPDLIIDCGSGKWSSLGVLAAFSQKNDVISVDPRKDFVFHTGIKDYWGINNTLIELNEPRETKYPLLLCCHSHAPLGEVKAFLSRFQRWVYITMPCCVDNRLPNHPSRSILDANVFSEKRSIYCYERGAT